MDIIYKKDTLYVYLDEEVDEQGMSALEDKVDGIMSTYNIENLVIDTHRTNQAHLRRFESSYNSRHRSRVVIK